MIIRSFKKISAVIGEFVSEFFSEVISGGIKCIGAWVRYLFLRKKYSYKEVILQDWNTRVGLLIISIPIAILLFLFI